MSVHDTNHNSVRFNHLLHLRNTRAGFKGPLNDLLAYSMSILHDLNYICRTRANCVPLLTCVTDSAGFAQASACFVLNTAADFCSLSFSFP